MKVVIYGGELYHHGILGQKWGVRRYQNLDGTLTEAGKRRQIRHINNVYKHLDTQQKRLVSDEPDPPKKFTTVDQHSNFALKSFVEYDRSRPVSTVTVWRHGNDEAMLSVMTRKDYQGKGYGKRVVNNAMRWLETSGVKKAYWGADLDNDPSISMAKSMGFQWVETNKDKHYVMFEKGFSGKI